MSNKKNELACLLDEVDLKGKMRLGEPQSAPPVDKQTITMVRNLIPNRSSLSYQEGDIRFKHQPMSRLHEKKHPGIVLTVAQMR